MFNKKTRKLATVSVLLVSVLAGSVLAGAKTKTVQLKEGACYTLPKKAGSIVVKNKKVVKLLKIKKLKALKEGNCKVTYVKKGKKYVLKVVVARHKPTLPSEAVQAPVTTPVITPSPTATPVPTQSVNNQGEEKPKATPWGPSDEKYCIYHLVVNKMEMQNDNDTVKVYLDSLGEGYEPGNIYMNYPIETGKVVCMVYVENANKFKTGDYVSLYFSRSESTNKVTIDKANDVTIVDGISAMYESKPPVN